MTIVPFGELLLDRADFKNPGALQAINAVPSASGYEPVQSLSVISDALGARPRGAIQARDKNLTVFQYAGDATKLYQFSDQTWSDVSNGTYTTGSEENWEFVKWKNKILATNFSDDPQSITFGDANFADLVTTFTARHIAVINNFVVVGNLNDDSDGLVPNRVKWSHFNDETSWTVSAANLSDIQDLATGGAIQKIVGGEFGVVLTRKSVWRMSFAGAPTVFEFDEVLPGIGTLSPGSVVRDGDIVYFLSDKGFFALVNGTQATPIGANKIDQFVLNELDQSNLHRISGVADPNSKRIYWALPLSGNTSGRPNKIVVFDSSLGRWSIIEDEIELLWSAGGTGFTLDGLDDFMLGSELVTNGAFAADTDWTKGTGWTISGGTATHGTGTASDIEQSISVTENTYYRVSVTTTGITAGSVTPKVGGTSGTAITTNTTTTETIRCGSGSLIEFTATSDFDGDLDDVTVKEISDLDDMSLSLDSSAFVGGAPELSAFDTDFKHGFFNGDNMTATLTTKEVEIHEGNRTHLNAFRPLVDGGTVTAKVGTRNRQTDEPTFGSSLTQSSSGRFTCRENARFHRFQLSITGEWNHAIGVQVIQREARRADGR